MSDFDKYTGREDFSKAFDFMRTGVLGSADLEASTADVTTGSTGTYAIAGKVYSWSSAIDFDLSDLVTSKTLEDGFTTILWFFVDAEGSGSVIEGDAVDDDDTPFELPDFDPEEVACLGYVKIKNDSSSDFTIGTTALSTSGITDTYVNFAYGVVPGTEVAV